MVNKKSRTRSADAFGPTRMQISTSLYAWNLVVSPKKLRWTPSASASLSPCDRWPRSTRSVRRCLARPWGRGGVRFRIQV